MKKLYALICTLLVALCGSVAIPLFTSVNEQDDTIESVTITELGNPTIAGPGGSYYDDGVLYYTSTGNTIGYNIDHSDKYIEFELMFNALAFPSWFSLTLKASGCDRTQSPNLEQKGYSFVLFPAGSVQVWKDGATIASVTHAPFVTGAKYKVKLGAVNVNDKVSLSLIIDEQEVIGQTDTQNPFFEGNWFNICSDGAVSANIISTKKVVYPSYYTYTMATIGAYPLKAGAPQIDKYNNATLNSSGDTIGFNQSHQNFSLEMKFNFSTFKWPANFWLSARTQGFDRVMSANLAEKGYSFRLNAGGTVEIYKELASLGAASVDGGFEAGKDYIIEIGVVDIDKNTTNLFLSVNNKMVLSVNDSDKPIQKHGLINMNGDGEVAVKITSSLTKITPLQTTKSVDDKIRLTTFFLNPPYSNLSYSEFGERNLKAMLFDDISIYDINKNYYSLNNQQKEKAIDVSFVDNKLVIEIAKTIYSNSGAEPIETKYNLFAIKKTAVNSGFVCSNGFVLKQTYYFNL